MTRHDVTSASVVAAGMDVPDDFPCCGRRPHKPREKWSFTGRETHWGYTYLVWTRSGDGKRFVRVVL